MRRRVWAWPVGIVGNVMLFTVFFGAAFANPQDETLYGQAGRQVFFIIISIYGWWRWSADPRRAAATRRRPAVTPRWATTRRAARRTSASGRWSWWSCSRSFSVIGAGWPAPRWYFWCDAWIFVGSMLATYAMARGWVDFWLAWIAVDLVGVPAAGALGLLPLGRALRRLRGLVVYGFFVWLRVSRDDAGPRPRAE